MSRRTPRHRVPLGVVALLGVALGAVLGAVARPDWLAAGHDRARAWLDAGGPALERIDFLGLDRLEPAALAERASLADPLPLVDVDPAAVCAALTEHPGIAGCSAVRVPPDRLIIEVEERRPIAAIAPAETSAAPTEGVSADGHRMPLLVDEAAGLPLLSGDAGMALPALLEARSLGIELRSIHATTERDLLLQPVEASPQLRVGLETGRALRSWLELRQSGALRGHAANEIDLRFRGNAVLRGVESAKDGGTRDGSL